MNFPEDEAEFRQAWANCAGAQGAFYQCQKQLEEAASKAFVAGKDELASVLRSIGRDIAAQAAAKSEELHSYIAESDRRDEQESNG